jgi:hypothetical protein
MIETWRDSWFEHGMRVFYLVPREQVDRLLPLKIAPEPSSIGRVFVGRVEVLSPRTRHTITTALNKGDIKALVPLGRFLQPFAQQIAPQQPLPELPKFNSSSAACVE